MKVIPEEALGLIGQTVWYQDGSLHPQKYTVAGISGTKEG